jgi:PknH-like extracellular domain
MAIRAARNAIGLAAGAVLLVGCTQTIAGTAHPEHARTGSALGQVLLSESEISDIMGTTGLEVVASSEDMVDSSEEVSEHECLGALYNGEKAVYDGTGWVEIVDQVITEPEDDSEHWVEQTAVLFSSAERAADFLDRSKITWANCIGKSVTVDEGGDEFSWRLEGVTIDGASVSQTARQSDDAGWSCRHVLRAASDVIIEVSTCGADLHGQAATIAEKIAGNVK